MFDDDDGYYDDPVREAWGVLYGVIAGTAIWAVLLFLL